MGIAEGDRFKHRLTGQLYEAKMIKGDTFILESAHIPYSMWSAEEGSGIIFKSEKV